MLLLKILILSCMIILRIEEKYFYRYCLQAFSTKKTLKCHIKDFFKLNDKRKNIMPKNNEYVKFKNYEKKTFIQILKVI